MGTITNKARERRKARGSPAKTCMNGTADRTNLIEHKRMPQKCPYNFECRTRYCAAHYAVIRKSEQPSEPPTCDICHEKLPDRDGDDWLTYLPAEPVL
jgi:hypothetical protein